MKLHSFINIDSRSSFPPNRLNNISRSSHSRVRAKMPSVFKSMLLSLNIIFKSVTRLLRSCTFLETLCLSRMTSINFSYLPLWNKTLIGDCILISNSIKFIKRHRYPTPLFYKIRIPNLSFRIVFPNSIQLLIISVPLYIHGG